MGPPYTCVPTLNGYGTCNGQAQITAFTNMLMMWGGEYLGLRTPQSSSVLTGNLLSWARANAPSIDPAWAAQGNFGELPSTGVPGKTAAGMMPADPLMKGGMPGAETMKANGEDFNVFRGVFNGTWFARLTVPPAPRKVAKIELAAMLKKSGVTDATGVVDAFTHRFLRAPITGKRREGLIAFCASQLGG